MNASSDQISVRRYIDPISRFAPLVLVGALAGAGLGFAAYTLSGTTYTSGVSVLVSPISGDPVDGLGTSAVEVDMATEAEVATSLVVAERANDLLEGRPPAKDPRDLLGQVETSVRGTRIMEMDFTASEPEIAQRGAAAFAEAFLSYRDELATSQLEVSSGRLEERIAQLQLELTDVSTRRAEVPEAERDGAAYAALAINEQTLLDELSVNQGRLADLRAVVTDDAVVLDAASLPKSPSSLGMPTLLVGGAAVGFVLAAGLALMLDAARRRGEDDELAEEMAARQVLAVAAEDVEAVAVSAPPTAPIPAPVDDAPAWEPTADAVTGWDASAFDDDPASADAVAADFMAAGLDEIPDPFAAVDRPDDPDGYGTESVGVIDDRWSLAPETAPVPGLLPDRLEPNGFGGPHDGLDPDSAEVPDPDRWAGTDTTPRAIPDEMAPVPVGDGLSLSAPVDLDDLLHERALASVAQLGDHLTRAVDADRRVVVVVDGGDGAARPVAVAMAAHLAAGGRQSVLIDPRGDVLADVATGRHQVRDHPTLDLVVGDSAGDDAALVDDYARDATVVVFDGDVLDSHLVTAPTDWPGAIVIATTGVANPASIPEAAFEQVMGSHHPLIGIVSIMARPAMAPPSS